MLTWSPAGLEKARHRARPGAPPVGSWGEAVTIEKPVLELRFQTAHPIDAPGEVALEDYARVLTRAEAAEALRSESDPESVAGVRLSAPGGAPSAAMRKDIEDFARDLARRGGGSGLGWA